MNIYVGDTTEETLEDFDLRISKLEFVVDEILEELKKKEN